MRNQAVKVCRTGLDLLRCHHSLTTAHFLQFKFPELYTPAFASSLWSNQLVDIPPPKQPDHIPSLLGAKDQQAADAVAEECKAREKIMSYCKGAKGKRREAQKAGQVRKRYAHRRNFGAEPSRGKSSQE